MMSSTLETHVRGILKGTVSDMTIRSILSQLGPAKTSAPDRLAPDQRRKVLTTLKANIALHVKDSIHQTLLMAKVSSMLISSSTSNGSSASTSRTDAAAAAPRRDRSSIFGTKPTERSSIFDTKPTKRQPRLQTAFQARAQEHSSASIRIGRRGTSQSIPIETSNDLVKARMAAKELALTIGFTNTNSVRIATAVSELARNIIFYAETGEILLTNLEPSRVSKAGLEIVARDDGPGIQDLESILAGTYSSSQGLGIGLKGVKSMMDEFDIVTGRGKGTSVKAIKWL